MNIYIQAAYNVTTTQRNL